VTSTGTATAEDDEHVHGFSGTTGTENQQHDHAEENSALGTYNWSTSTEQAQHDHNFSGTTNGRSATHDHPVSVTGTTSTPSATGSALRVRFLIKT
jgi:hypothetical protein